MISTRHGGQRRDPPGGHGFCRLDEPGTGAEITARRMPSGADQIVDYRMTGSREGSIRLKPRHKISTPFSLFPPSHLKTSLPAFSSRRRLPRNSIRNFNQRPMARHRLASRLLLSFAEGLGHWPPTSVAEPLAGKGSEPVIQLQITSGSARFSLLNEADITVLAKPERCDQRHPAFPSRPARVTGAPSMPYGMYRPG